MLKDVYFVSTLLCMGIYTMSQDIMQMSFLSITFFCLDLECSNLVMMLVINEHAFVLI